MKPYLCPAWAFLAACALASVAPSAGQASPLVRAAGQARTLTLQQPKKVDFSHDVLPLLKARCAECHTAGKSKGGVSFDTREALLRSKAVVPGKSAASEIILRVTNADPEKRMPPKGPPLTPREIAALRAWVDQGVAWEPGFSFK